MAFAVYLLNSAAPLMSSLRIRIVIDCIEGDLRNGGPGGNSARNWNSPIIRLQIGHHGSQSTPGLITIQPPRSLEISGQRVDDLLFKAQHTRISNSGIK